LIEAPWALEYGSFESHKGSLIGPNRGDLFMLLILCVILLALWLLGFVAFHVAGGLIHLLLVLAIIALIVHFVRRAA
jgi:hypothetical protein